MQARCEVCLLGDGPLLDLATKASALKCHLLCALFFPQVRLLDDTHASCPILPSDSYVSDCVVCLNRQGIQGMLLPCHGCPVYLHRNCLAQDGLVFLSKGDSLLSTKVRLFCLDCSSGRTGLSYAQLLHTYDSRQSVAPSIEVDLSQLEQINLFLDQDSLLKQQEAEQLQALQRQREKEFRAKRLQDRPKERLADCLAKQLRSKHKLQGKRLRTQAAPSEVSAIVKVDAAYWAQIGKHYLGSSSSLDHLQPQGRVVSPLLSQLDQAIQDQEDTLHQMQMAFWTKSAAVRQAWQSQKQEPCRLAEAMAEKKSQVDWHQTLSQMKRGLEMHREEVILRGAAGPPMETDCMVCMDFVTNEFNPIIYCSKCNNSFHQLCIGLPRIPQEDFFCDQCQEGDGTEECMVCGLGCMSLVKLQGHWLHPLCLVTARKGVLLNKQYRLLEQLADKSQGGEVASGAGVRTCRYCGGGNVQVRCGECGVGMHLLCGYFAGGRAKVSLGTDDLLYYNHIDFISLQCQLDCHEHHPQQQKQSFLRKQQVNHCNYNLLYADYNAFLQSGPSKKVHR